MFTYLAIAICFSVMLYSVTYAMEIMGFDVVKFFKTDDLMFAIMGTGFFVGVICTLCETPTNLVELVYRDFSPIWFLVWACLTAILHKTQIDNMYLPAH